MVTVFLVTGQRPGDESSEPTKDLRAHRGAHMAPRGMHCHSLRRFALEHADPHALFL